jgi:CheY-like chemotaxis protein
MVTDLSTIRKTRGRLLIVEDKRSLRELLSHICVSDGYEVLTAQDGLDALGLLVEPLPNMIISDLNMPRMSGFEFLSVIREEFPLIPVLAMSAEFSAQEPPDGLLADAFLYKGDITLDQLRITIDQLVSAPPPRLLSAAGNIGPA